MATSTSAAASVANDATAAHGRGVTPRVVILSLLLAVFFAYVIPVIDYKFFNTFLGATHLPPGAVGALILLMLIVVNPLLRSFVQTIGFGAQRSFDGLPDLSVFDFDGWYRRQQLFCIVYHRLVLLFDAREPLVRRAQRFAAVVHAGFGA